MFATKNKLIATLGAGALVLGIAGQATGQTTAAKQGNSADRAGIAILDRPGIRFERSLAVAHYTEAYAKAKKAGAAPKHDLSQVAGVSTARLRSAAHRLDNAASAPAVSSPETYGVSQSTLDAIAACESGGNPAAVSPDGTYRGKYQFDYGTWASVGGSGDPAAAPEAEQDMRAAMLYSEAGSSPWPICG